MTLLEHVNEIFVTIQIFKIISMEVKFYASIFDICGHILENNIKNKSYKNFSD